MKNFNFLFLALFLLFFNNLTAQTTNYESAPKAKTEVLFGVKAGWIHNCWALPLTMESPMGKVDIERRKLRKKQFGDYLVGLKCYVRHPQHHFGGFFFLEYRNRGFNMKYPGEEEYKTHVTHIISPAAGVQCRIGKLKSRHRLLLETGIAYNINCKYKGSYENNLKVVKNGFSGIYGIGHEHFYSGNRNEQGFHTQGTHNTWCILYVIEYRQDYFNFFNHKFTTDGIQPYKGFKNFFGYLSFTVIARRRSTTVK